MDFLNAAPGLAARRYFLDGSKDAEDWDCRMAVITRTMLVAVCLWGAMLPVQAGITETSWGMTADDGRPASLYTLTNANGMEVAITSYGATIVSIRLPAAGGDKVNVVQGFDSLADYTSADYVAANGHYGMTIGRFANRIRGAKIVLDGQTYSLDPDKNGDLDQGGRMAYFRQVFRGVAKDGAERAVGLRGGIPRRGGPESGGRGSPGYCGGESGTRGVEQWREVSFPVRCQCVRKSAERFLLVEEPPPPTHVARFPGGEHDAGSSYIRGFIALRRTLVLVQGPGPEVTLRLAGILTLRETHL